VTLKYPVDVFFDHDGNAVRGFHMTGGVRLAVLGRNWEKASLNGRGRGRVRTGTALGAVIGGVVSGVVAPMSKSDDARIAAPILLSAWGAGAGAAFGALLNLAR
jgi:hypothetical protein